ncbi:MAG: HMA2 domain-containing protein [Sphingomonadaceae bacterium]
MQDGRTAVIVHSIPGRIRVRLDKSSRSPDFMRTLVETLSAVEGVNRVEANPATGSVLLLYDPQVMDPEQLYLAARSAHLSVVLPGAGRPTAQPDEITPIASGINSAIGRLDRAIFNFTSGNLDTKTLVPFGLAAAAIRQIVTSRGNVATAPWYVLLWYSFSLFHRFNRRR